MTVATVDPFLAGNGVKLRDEIETRSEADPQFLNGTSLEDSLNSTSSSSEKRSGVGTRRSSVMECDAARQTQTVSSKQIAVLMTGHRVR